MLLANCCFCLFSFLLDVSIPIWFVYKLFCFQVYIVGGVKSDPIDDNNNFVEVLDTNTGEIQNTSTQMFPNANGGLSFACVISLPEDNAFVITGGEIYSYNK